MNVLSEFKSFSGLKVWIYRYDKSTIEGELASVNIKVRIEAKEKKELQFSIMVFLIKLLYFEMYKYHIVLY